MSNLIRYFSILSASALSVALSSCYIVSFEDVSSKPPYSAYAGKHFKSSHIANIYRISTDPNYKPTPSHYVIKAPSGISGPEVLSHAQLPASTTFKVLKVVRCIDCYLDFGERIHVVVQLTSTGVFNDAEIHVSDKLLGGTFVEVSNDARS